MPTTQLMSLSPTQSRDPEVGTSTLSAPLSNAKTDIINRCCPSRRYTLNLDLGLFSQHHILREALKWAAKYGKSGQFIPVNLRPCLPAHLPAVYPPSYPFTRRLPAQLPAHHFTRDLPAHIPAHIPAQLPAHPTLQKWIPSPLA